MASPPDLYYDERGLIVAFVDACRPPYPHQDFQTFRQARLRALERAFGLRLSADEIPDIQASVLWMHFQATVRSFLALDGPGAGLLEGGLLERAIDERDN